MSIPRATMGWLDGSLVCTSRLGLPSGVRGVVCHLYWATGPSKRKVSHARQSANLVSDLTSGQSNYPASTLAAKDGSHLLRILRFIWRCHSHAQLSPANLVSGRERN